LEREFTVGETIGAGSYGRVFAARHKTSGQIVAVKEIHFERRDKDEGREPDCINRECRLCEQLRHECIVRYFGHELTDSENGVETLRLFLEFCSGGSVASHLRTYGPLEPPLVARYGRQLMEGLRYLHSRSPPVVHRDLKCANLLLTHDANVKITDFGCSKWLQEDRQKQDTVVGSVFWTAPEVLLGTAETTTAVDMWGFSCCILEMATAENPWSEKKIDNIFQACRLVMDPKEMPAVPPDLPEEIKAAIDACMVRDPAERASADALKALPLFATEELLE
jgi:mitogen-activated protein kinase kinase kinase